MGIPARPREPSEDPLLADSPQHWDELIEAVGPASMLVVIEGRMSAALRARLAPEDVWQETLLHAWRDRARLEWKGAQAFRRWLLAIAENRLRDLADRELADKRGGAGAAVPIAAECSSSDGRGYVPVHAGPVASTTPSRLASERELALAMRQTLDSLPDDCREVVRLRLFEDVSLEEIARRLALSPDAALRRFRKGAEIYHKRLNGFLKSPSQVVGGKSAAGSGALLSSELPAAEHGDPP